MKNLLTIILLNFLTLPLLASLTFDDYSKEELRVLKKLDISSSFLYDEELQKTLDSYTKNYEEKHYFQTMNDAYLFIPYIKDLMANADVPDAFLFMAMAESNFKNIAKSHKSASGMWQFMEFTGKKYGLIIDNYVDERRDMIKSTQAAIQYISALHDEFGKWYLAAIAYNCGEARLQEGIARLILDKYCQINENFANSQKAKEYRDIIKGYQAKKIPYRKFREMYNEITQLDIDFTLSELLARQHLKREYLPKESRSYIRKIVSFALMASDKKYLLAKEFDYLLNRGRAYTISTVTVGRGEQLSALSELLKIRLEDLQALNAHLKYDFTPPYLEKYQIYIPYLKLSAFNALYTKPSNNYFVFHKVTTGDSLGKIARYYGISYKIIKDFNHLKSSKIHVGQKLLLPINKDSNPNHSPLAKVSVAKEPKLYTVKSGDTLYGIAKEYKMDIASLKKLNNLNGNSLQIGDKLYVSK